jgi:4-amino-4-deoxy-L-arabinose transferase-like glycosyltransferase
MRKILDFVARASTLQTAISLYALAALIRLAIAVLRGLNTTPPIGDEWGYYVLANRMIEGLGYSRLWPDGILRPAGTQMPGTSLFIAVGLLIFGKHPYSAYLMAVLISSASVPLMYLFARRLTSNRVAIAAASACMLYPTWAFYSTSSLSEPFFIPLLLLALLLTSIAFTSTDWRTAICAGLAWGAAALVRPHGVPMAMLVSAYLLWRKGWRQSALVALGCVLVVGPWVVRNQRMFGSPVLATESGETFLGSNNPYVLKNPKLHGMWLSTWEIPEYRRMIEFNFDELERSRIQNKVGWAYLRQNPGVIPRLTLYKVRRWLTPITVSGGAVRLMVLISYGPLLLFLGIGLFRKVYRRCIELDLISMWSLIMLGITIVYWGNLTRGRLPLEMVWIPWATIEVADVFSRFRVRVADMLPADSFVTSFARYLVRLSTMW